MGSGRTESELKSFNKNPFMLSPLKHSEAFSGIV